MSCPRFSLAVILALTVVTITAAQKNDPSKTLPALNGIKGLRQAADPEDNPASRLAKAIATARVEKNPQALMGVLYASASVLSAMLYNPPNYLIFDQFDSFFYIAELLPQEYQLNYVKRM